MTELYCQFYAGPGPFVPAPLACLLVHHCSAQNKPATGNPALFEPTGKKQKKQAVVS